MQRPAPWLLGHFFQASRRSGDSIDYFGDAGLRLRLLGASVELETGLLGGRELA